MEAEMWKARVVAGSLMWAALLAGAGLAGAQPASLTVRGVVEGDIVEGRVTRSDPPTRSITLDNGQDYLVPRVVALDWESVRDGTTVKVRYSVDGGRNVATLVDVQP